MYSIYNIVPAPWGDSYRFVEMFDTEEDAEEVLAALEKVNILFNLYKIVEEDNNQTNKTLQAEIKRLRERYKDQERLWELADQDNCEGNCDLEPPHKQCAECLARSVINECGEIFGDATREIEQVLKKDGEQ